MKKHYDFSKGEKGKFYVPEEEIKLPIYLDSKIQKYFYNLANEKKIEMSNLINNLLNRDMELINMLNTKSQ